MSLSDTDLWNLIRDDLIDFIDQQADEKGGLRADYADVMGARNYGNRNFEEIVDLFYKRFDDLYQTETRLDEEQIVKKYVPSFINGHFALTVCSDQEISRRLGDREYEDMMDASEAFTEKWVGRSRQRGRRSASNGTAYSIARGSNLGAGGRTRNTDTRRRRNERGTGHLTSSWSANQEEPEERPTPRRQRNTQETPPRTEPAERPARPVVEMPEKEGVDYTLARPWDAFKFEGRFWKVLHKVDLKADYDWISNLNKPVTLVDINKFIPYLVQDKDGKVSQEVHEVNDDNAYIAHELRNSTNLAGDAGRSRQFVDPAKPLHQPLNERVRGVDLAKVFSDLKLDDLGLSHKLVDSTEPVTQAALARLASDDQQQQRLMSFIVRTVIVLHGSTAAEVDPHLTRLGLSANLSEAHQILSELKGTLPEALWNALNKRFTKVICDILVYQFQMPVKSFDFHLYWDQMLSGFTKRRGEELLQAFISRTRVVPMLVVRRLPPDVLLDYIEDLVDNVGKPPEAVVFTDYSVAVATRHTSAELGIGDQLNPEINPPARLGLAVDDDRPDVFTGLQNLYRKFQDEEAIRNLTTVHLVTLDNRHFAIRRYACRGERYIINQQ